MQVRAIEVVRNVVVSASKDLSKRTAKRPALEVTTNAIIHGAVTATT